MLSTYAWIEKGERQELPTVRGGIPVIDKQFGHISFGSIWNFK